ncbi:F-box protein [Morus notabilis]|uniref:F-box protein n=1 Tax=Morus notabilis TaxID=981085 RepID=W9SMW8_9ROSA|nr:F-box protein At4g35930 [Morus notabilis]XP_024032876.1 F-box protein At4g35930 [Morus notabilis]EXC35317.1 F-box protein [Morus notabilis]
MGKVSPKERNRKQKKRLRGSSKYLKPRALARLRYSKASASKSCTDLGRKRVAVLETEKAESDIVLEENAIDKSPLMLSPVNLVKQSSFFGTPKTPTFEACQSESRLESLPMDLLVKVLCHLHHDQLRAVFHVSQRVRKAVLIARQFYFNYTTPDRSRQEMLRTMTPRPTEHWPFASKGDGKGIWLPSPHTPKAPRQGPRPPSRLKASEVRQVAAVLFQESALPARCMVPSVLAKPLCKSLASNRVLFYEEELCQAVAQNKLR